jgi:hypothetical protein
VSDKEELEKKLRSFKRGLNECRNHKGSDIDLDAYLEEAVDLINEALSNLSDQIAEEEDDAQEEAEELLNEEFDDGPDTDEGDE